MKDIAVPFTEKKGQPFTAIKQWGTDPFFPAVFTIFHRANSKDVRGIDGRME